MGGKGAVSPGVRDVGAEGAGDARERTSEGMRDSLELLRTRIAARYRIEDEIGRGGHGYVMRATDLRHHRPVAIKVLRSEPGGALSSARFRREIRLIAGLHHPHILPLYDSGCEHDVRYYVMPLIEGASLRERITRDGRLPVREALDITRQVASALVEAHRRGIVHRDIKPENILISGRAALLADFGIACAMHEAEPGDVTGPGVVLGTPAYMSPEQGAPGEQIDGRADVYSLGCVLHEVLAGTPPFGGESPAAILARHAVAPAPDVTDTRPDVPPPVARLLQRALAKNPDDRFDALELEAALDAAMLCLAPDDAAPHSHSWLGARWIRRVRAALG